MVAIIISNYLGVILLKSNKKNIYKRCAYEVQCKLSFSNLKVTLCRIHRDLLAKKKRFI